MTTEYFPVCCIAFPMGEEGLEYLGTDEEGNDVWMRGIIERPPEKKEEPKEEEREIK